VVIYVAGEMALLVGMPSLFGEIVAGFLLGPPLADFVPFPHALVLIGEIGLIMLLLEAGIDIDVAQLKVTGLRAIFIAFTGAFSSLGVGIGLSYAMGVHQWQAAIALGATFAPTSLAVASNALNTGKVLNTPVGQLIVASCVIDDVIGLVILSMLEVLVEEEAQIHEYFLPIISAVVFLGVLGYVAIIWMPVWVDKFIYQKLPEPWHTPVCFTLMIFLLMAYMPLMYVSKASYLTGAFLAGLSFSQIPPIHHAFIHHTANVFAWLLRIFFSSSIGFQVSI
jgi:Kef-type K+ transport system membrane component KefB